MFDKIHQHLVLTNIYKIKEQLNLVYLLFMEFIPIKILRNL